MTLSTHSLVSIRSYLEESMLHQHDYHQIVLPHLGHLELEVAGHGGFVVNGTGAMIGAGAPHAFRAKGANSFLVVDLPLHVVAAERLTRYCDEKRAFFPITPSTQGLVDYAVATFGRAKPSRANLSRWSSLLTDSLEQDRSVEPCTETLALNRAMAFLRRHACESIRVTDVAAAAGLSVTRFHTTFRKRYGQSPHAALMQLRIDAARQLLIGSNLPIAEIAARTGHADQSALTRRLRLALGVTPAALRRTARSVPTLKRSKSPPEGFA
jgi:AraC-like DNA-binding protein